MASDPERELGQLLQVHGISYIRVLAKLAMGLLFLLLVSLNDAMCLLVILVLFSPYFIFMPLLRLVKRPRIELYESGIRTRKKTWYWNEISGLSRTYLMEIISLGVFHIGEYRLYHGNEKVISINYDYARTDKLISIIEAKTAEHLIPIYLSELREKGTLIFGKIQLTEKHISASHRTVKLSEIGNAYLFANQLRISKHGGMLGSIIIAFAVSISYVMNYHILLFLLDILIHEAKLSGE